MVGFADARYDRDEEARFIATAANDPALADFPSTDLEATYNTLVREFSTDYAGAAAGVLGAIKTLRDKEPVKAAVIFAARLAIVADKRILPQEEAALSSISQALDLEPDVL